MGGHLLLLSRPSPMIRPLISRLCKPIMRYSHVSKEDNDNDYQHPTEVKAPSLADEFKRVAKEKAKAKEDARTADQGVASQTAGTAYDGTEETVIGRGGVEAVQERWKEQKPGADYRRRGIN